MVKGFLKRIGLALVVIFMVQLIAFAQEAGSGSGSEPGSPEEAGFQSRCQSAPDMGFPKCASSPSECISDPEKNYRYPFNCIFLQEPIGGDPGYDLFKLSEATKDGSTYNNYQLWYGEAIVAGEYGPLQAILVYEEGKDLQGPFGLVYNYLGLVYNFMSGLIIAFVILMVIVGGIRMSTSGGNTDAYGKGKSMIIKALVGMVLWFLASVILYTINPTFFTF